MSEALDRRFPPGKRLLHVGPTVIEGAALIVDPVRKAVPAEGLKGVVGIAPSDELRDRRASACRPG